METQAWTPLKLISWTTDYFHNHGVEEARLDAELLLAHVLGVDRIMLYAGFERVVTPGELARYRAMVKDRAAGRPAKYIIGRAEFHSLPFAVDERVLVPRPETEILVERALAVLEEQARGEFQLVVEIGTGSGAVAISIAANFAEANLIATDVSPAALDVARANAEANNVASRIEFLCGDLFEPLATLGLEGRVDVVVSNPPYVSEREWDKLPREIRSFEPRLALVAGPGGTEIHLRLIAEAPQYLRQGGALLLEMDASQKDALSAAAQASGAYADAEFYQDYARLSRVAAMRRL